MQQKQFSLAAIPEMTFSVTKTVLDARSPLNQNDAHIHAECEVYINLSGNVAFAVEDRLYAVSRGTVIITMPYEYHHCIYRSDAPHAHYWITFTAPRDQDYLKLFFDREKGINNRIDLNQEELSRACAILDSVLNEQVEGLERQILMLQFIQLLRDGTGVCPEGSVDQLPEDVAAALRYMDTHLDRELDIKTLAQSCNVSVNTLERHFKEHLHTTPFVILRRKRLFASMMYLKSGSSVTEAAQKCGFSDYSNYIQLFKKQFGLTPGQYKRKI